MPELPEVETVVRDLQEAGLQNRTIVRTSVSWPRTIGDLTPNRFAARMRGKRILRIHRRAKFIIIDLPAEVTLLIHLRMTGRLHFAPTGTPRSPHEHVAIWLDDGRELRFHDTRKFGRWYAAEGAIDRLKALGPEPLDADFKGADLAAALAGHRRMLKPLLLDQHIIAGLGNIYVDEALFGAGLHPCRASDALTRADIQRLHRSIRTVLRRGIRAMGTSLGDSDTNFYSVAGRRGRNQDQLRVFRRTGEPCPRCGTPIARLIVAQRSTHICPACQPE